MRLIAKSVLELGWENLLFEENIFWAWPMWQFVCWIYCEGFLFHLTQWGEWGWGERGGAWEWPQKPVWDWDWGSGWGWPNLDQGRIGGPHNRLLLSSSPSPGHIKVINTHSHPLPQCNDTSAIDGDPLLGSSLDSLFLLVRMPFSSSSLLLRLAFSTDPSKDSTIELYYNFYFL